MNSLTEFYNKEIAPLGFGKVEAVECMHDNVEVENVSCSFPGLGGGGLQTEVRFVAYCTNCGEMVEESAPDYADDYEGDE